MFDSLWVIGGGPIAEGVLRNPLPVLERMANRINVDLIKGCHLWTGRLNSDGYGVIYTQSLTRLAHRLAFALRHGPIPREDQVDDGRFCILHKCDVARCCNTDHLYRGSKKENGRDMRERGRWSAGKRVPLTTIHQPPAFVMQRGLQSAAQEQKDNTDAR